MAQRIFFTALLVFLIASAAHFDRRKQAVSAGDSFGYFVNLPAFFVHGDVGSYEKTMAAHRTHNPGTAHDPLTKMGLPESPTGARYTKYPIGVAILQAPFFLLAHLFCKTTEAFPADGWSQPYVLSAIWAGIFYGFMGLMVLFSALRGLFHSIQIRLFVATGLALGTNLFYHTTYNPGMSHVFEFFLFAVLVWLLEKWGERPGGWKRFAEAGSVCGLITLVRHSDALCLLVPVLFLASRANFRGLPKKLWANRKGLAAATVAFAAPLLLQSIYWLKTTGRFWFDGYRGEAFKFLHPQFLKGTLGFTNGWLTYTPLMFLAVFGLFFGLWRRGRNWFWPTVILLPAHMWVIYSWWCWMYINGFGSRPMIDIYPVLAVAMAAFVQSVWAKKMGRVLATAFLAACIWLNLFQTWQIAEGLYWSEGGSRGFYWAMFGKTEPSPVALISFDSGLVQPDIDGLEKTATIHLDSMENPANDPNISAKNHFSGRHGLNCLAEINRPFQLKLDTFPAAFDKKTWFRASVMGFLDGAADPFTWSRDDMATVWATFTNPDGKVVSKKAARIASKLGNPTGSIWSAGQPGVWGEAYFFYQTPKKAARNARMDVYIWNPNGQRVYVDDLRVEVWREKR